MGLWLKQPDFMLSSSCRGKKCFRGLTKWGRLYHLIYICWRHYMHPTVWLPSSAHVITWGFVPVGTACNVKESMPATGEVRGCIHVETWKAANGVDGRGGYAHIIFEEQGSKVWSTCCKEMTTRRARRIISCCYIYPVLTPSNPSLAISMKTSCIPSYLAIRLHLRVSISLLDLHSTTSRYLCMSPSSYSYSLCSFSVLPDYYPVFYVWTHPLSLSHNSLSPSPCILLLMSFSLCPLPYDLLCCILISNPTLIVYILLYLCYVTSVQISITSPPCSSPHLLWSPLLLRLFSCTLNLCSYVLQNPRTQDRQGHNTYILC